ncbi:serine hydrolase [Naasia sp. SYSU D00948]|uniref:serine hydrolase domain-containing protein n=1 Tax=Naasia sp. SYSU D00948 TaxID=2817379 RepID=UPI001B30C36F|nr:serine hydrolase [Naasia sp. SYSU D00948]
MAVPLPSASPSSQGVDARGIEAFLDALESDPRIEPHSIMLLRHGRVVASGWWSPFTEDRPHLLYSLSKTFTATALGFAVAEGLVTLDDLVVDHFPEFADEITTPRARAIRIRHLAAMASGHTQDMVGPATETDPDEPVRGFLLHEPEQEPGTVFAYNQPATYTVAAIIQRRAGTDLVGYLRPRLLDPLGIDPVSWQEHPKGRSLGFTGLFASTDAVAKLGQLYLDEGRWKGEQLLPEGWAEEVRTRRVDTDWDADPDWRRGYGFQVWHARHGYRGDGAFGQFCVILPEQDAVLATTASTQAMQAVLDAAWEHLLPALGNGGDPDADARLVDRLAGLRLPAPGGSDDQPGDDAVGRYAPVTPAEGPSLESVELLRSGGVWSIELNDGYGGTVAAPVAGDGWTVSEEDGHPVVAVAGRWQNGRMAVSVLFLESPHRLELDLDPSRRTAGLRWVPAPLVALGRPGFTSVRAPRPLR